MFLKYCILLKKPIYIRCILKTYYSVCENNLYRNFQRHNAHVLTMLRITQAGTPGAQGIQGLKGNIGETGPTGPQGLQGLRGMAGKQGTLYTVNPRATLPNKRCFSQAEL